MEFALLGAGHETLPLVHALARDFQHRLVAFVATDSLAFEIRKVDPASRRLADPAEVLNLRDLDAIVVDSTDPEALEVTRQLAANGVAILLVPHAAHGIEFVYQLGLIRDEQPDQFRLYPIQPWREHPFILRLREIIQHQESGFIHQVQFERVEHVDCPGMQQPLISRTQISEGLLNDVDLLKFLVGEFDQVTAIETGDIEHGFLQSTVNLTGREAAPSQWSCRGSSGTTAWRLTVIAASGTIIMSGGTDRQVIHWESNIAGQQPESLTFDFGPAVLNEFLDGLATTEATSRWAEDLIRSFDLLEGVQRSLRRRRTVELYFDTPSERSNFKTQMTAIGCGVLLLTLLGMVFALGAGILTKELGLPPIFMQVLRVLVFAPLFIFLVLQFGVFLSKPSASSRSGTPDKI